MLCLSGAPTPENVQRPVCLKSLWQRATVMPLSVAYAASAATRPARRTPPAAPSRDQPVAEVINTETRITHQRRRTGGRVINERNAVAFNRCHVELKLVITEGTHAWEYHQNTEYLPACLRASLPVRCQRAAARHARRAARVARAQATRLMRDEAEMRDIED